MTTPQLISNQLADTDDADFRELYGQNIHIYRWTDKDRTFVLIMPGDWSKQKADAEAAQFNPEDHLCNDCPLCRATLKVGGTIVW